jgi:hypothetical protein
MVVLTLSLAALLACASSSGGGQASSQGVAPPASSPLSKVEVGMNDFQVRKILGEPDNMNVYPTGKSWIPFYFGGDTTRSDWMYKGMGRVVFSRNQYSGALKVIRVDYNPDENAGM